MAKQIDLLFGVKGGGAISGASGVEIKKAIDSIVSELNKSSSTKILVSIDEAPLKEQVKRIKAMLSDIALGGASGSSGTGKRGGSKNPVVRAAFNAQKAYEGLEMTMARVNKTRLSLKGLDSTNELSAALSAVKEFDVALRKVTNLKGGLLPFDQIKIEDLQAVSAAYKKIQVATLEATTASTANGNQFKKALKEEAAEAKRSAQIKVRAAKDTANAYSSLNQIRAQLDKRKLSLTDLDDTPQLKTAQAEVAKLEQALNKLYATNGQLKPLNQLSAADISAVIAGWNKVKIAIMEATTASTVNGNVTKKANADAKKTQSEHNQELDKTITKLNELNLAQGKFVQGSKIDEMISQWEAVGNGSVYSGNKTQYAEIAKSIDKIKDLKGELSVDGVMKPVSEDTRESYRELAQNLETLANGLKRVQKSSESLGMDKAFDKLHTLRNSLSNLESYPRLLDEYNRLEEQFKSGGFRTIEEANQAILKFGARCEEAGVHVNTLADNIIGKLVDRLKYLAAFFLTTAIYSGAQKIYQSVLDIDTAMTELRKVTDATEAEYIQFMDGAIERANRLGTSVKEVVQASSDYARLGYTIDEASELADSAIVYKNVGDGLSGIDQATEHLISTMKAFDIEAEDAMRIVDVFNEVANNFPTSAADIGEGLQRSAASLSAAGNSLEESVAIFTAAQAIQQDADVVGTALKTMAMRLRATKTELEEAGEYTEGMANSVSELRDKVLALSGVDIMLDEDTYKSTFQILKEISKVWDKLKNKEQASLLELLFGKKQGSIGAGLLKNFGMAEEALKTALDAEGSALKENEVFLESIQGHLNKLSAAWETFSYDFLDSEFVKGVIDFLTKVVNLLDDITNTIGGFGTAMAGLTASMASGSVIKTLFTALKGLPSLKDLLSFLMLGKGLEKSSVTSELIQGSVRAEKGLKNFGVSIKGVTTQLSVLAAVLGTVAVVAFGKWMTSLHSAEALTEKAKKSISEYKQTKQELEQLTSTLEDNIKRIEELQGLKDEGKISLVEEDELKRLQRENDLLETQIELLKAQEAQKAQKALEDAKDAYESGFSYTTYYSRYGTSEVGLKKNYQDAYRRYQENPTEANREAYLKYKQQAIEMRNQLLDAAELTGDTVAKAYAFTIDAMLNGVIDGIEEITSNPRYTDILSYLYDNPEATLGELFNKFGPAIMSPFLAALKAGGYAWDQFSTYIQDTYGKTKDDIEGNPIKVNADVIEAMEAVEKLSSSFKTLSNAFKEQAENGSLSIDTILDVIDAGYAAALSIDKETGAVRLNTQVYIALAKAKIQEQIASLQSRRAEIVAELTAEAKAAGAAAMAHLELAIASNESIKGLDSAIAALTALNNSDLSTVTSGLYGVGSAASSVKSQLSSLLSGMNSLLSTTMDWLRQSYEDSNNATKEWLESHKEALEKQLDDYNDLIDAQIELLERQKEADDYAKKRKDKEKTVSDIENQLVAIENDDSVEAQKKRLELQEELAKAKDDLAEVQDDWNYDQRKQALEDEKQKYQELIQAEIDAVQKRLDAVNSATISEMELRQRAYDWITNREEELYQQLIAWNREYGDGLDATIDNLFKDADGWRAYGATFKEALENLTRLAHDTKDAAGGIGAAFTDAAQIAKAALDDLIAKLREAAANFEEEGNTVGAKMLNSIARYLEQVKDLGIEMSAETSAKLYELLLNCDDATRNMIMNLISRFIDMKRSGVAEFDELWGRFIQDVTSADTSLFNGGSNMLANLQELWNALMQVRAEAENVGRMATDIRYTGKSGKAYETLTPYANGGVVDYTGPAMVHGKASSPEVVFNAQAASKLFNYVTQTPNLIAAALAQGSGMLKGYGSASTSLAGGDMGDININIAGNADASTVNELKRVAAGIKDDVIKTLNDSLRRRGITRSPRTV